MQLFSDETESFHGLRWEYKSGLYSNFIIFDLHSFDIDLGGIPDSALSAGPAFRAAPARFTER